VIGRKAQDRLTYAFPFQCIRRDDLFGSTDHEFSPLIIRCKRLFEPFVQFDVQASHISFPRNTENGAFRLGMDHHLGPEIWEIGTDQPVNYAPGCFTGLAFHGKTWNGLTNPRVSPVAANKILRLQCCDLAGLGACVGNFEELVYAFVGGVCNKRRAP